MSEREDAFLIGARLRELRHSRRLSTRDVERLSGGEFKSSVLGAYERGERLISAVRLVELARVYGVDPSAVLPAVTEWNEIRRSVLSARHNLSVRHRSEVVGAMPHRVLHLLNQADGSLAAILAMVEPELYEVPA